MADLVITVLDDSGAPLSGVACVGSLCDLEKNHLQEFTTEGILVEPVLAYSDGSGVAHLELVPNEQVQRANTYYSIKIANKPPILISKLATTQTLDEARVEATLPLGMAVNLGNLNDVDLTGLQAGDTIRRQGSKWVRWPWPSGSGADARVPWTAVTANKVLVETDALTRWEVNASGGPVTLTLPSAVGNEGLEFVVKRVDSSGNLVVVQAAGSELIDNSGAFQLDPGSAFNFSSNDAKWMVT